jgi:hypothetical protein
MRKFVIHWITIGFSKTTNTRFLRNCPLETETIFDTARNVKIHSTIDEFQKV